MARQFEYNQFEAKPTSPYNLPDVLRPLTFSAHQSTLYLGCCFHYCSRVMRLDV